MTGFTFWGLTFWDIVVLFIYFAVILFVGIRSSLMIKNREDYFMGGRRFGKLIQTFTAYGQATSVENVTATTTMVNTNGASGIWAMLAGGLLNLPVFWMTSIWYRRLRVLSLGDYFEERYGSKRMAAFYAMCQTIFFVMIGAFGLVAMTKTVAAITTKPETELTDTEYFEYSQALEKERLEAADFALLSAPEKERLTELQIKKPRKEFSYINENMFIWIVALVTLLYSSLGGLAAVVLVDFIQGLFTIILSIMLIPFAMKKINSIYGGEGFLGSFETMHKILPSSFMELWGSPHLIEFSWYWILFFSIMIVITTAAQGNQLTAIGPAKDDYTARYGFVSGVLLKRYSNVLWGLLALFTLVLYGDTISNPDYVWGHATRDLLGPVGAGLVGLMIASLIAALMSAKSTFLLSASAMITNNLYRPFRPNKSEAHYIKMGRVFGALYMFICAYFAMKSSSLFELFKMTMMFNSILAAAFWLGMLWRRSNAVGAWTSMIVMFIATVVLPFGLPAISGVQTSEYLSKTTEAIPVSRHYTASERDVNARDMAIARWKRLKAAGKAETECPEKLKTGDKFEKTTLLPPKSIFWSEGLDVDNGKAEGLGYLKVELVAVDLLGWDLSKRTYSFNETLTFIFRIIFPFFILMMVSRFTKPEAKSRLDQFYGKMLTPVKANEDDEEAMRLTRENPNRFRHLLMFPNSNWEFRKWNREDWKGVIGSSIAALTVVFLLILIVGIGRG
ncbi:MAG TPA: sodium:solute symporter family protein [Bacteroidales bacterium]|nr:sodium:solute symporter family protein [Bacteroidales bacterium]